MLNERERSHLEDAETRELRAHRRRLEVELDVTFNVKRTQWIEERISYINEVIDDRYKA